MKTAISLFISYLVAAALTEHVSMDMKLTHWTNLWTYFWIAFAGPIALIGASLVFAASAGIAALFTK